MSQTDIIQSEVADRYAQALLDLADESRSETRIVNDMAAFKKTLSSHETLTSMLANPVFATQDKVQAVTIIAKKAKLSDLAVNFIGTVAQNRRGHEYMAIIHAFEEAVARRKGTRTAFVTSAQKMTAAQIKTLETELKLSLGEDIIVQSDVDAGLLGGFIVRVGSRLYDNSLKTQIEDLKLALKSA